MARGISDAGAFWRRKHIAAKSGIIVAAFGLFVVIPAYVWVGRLHHVYLNNDLGDTIHIMGCDDAAIEPGETKKLRPRAPCYVFLDGWGYYGCLDFPDAALVNHETVPATTTGRLSVDECLDSDSYFRLSRLRTWLR